MTPSLIPPSSFSISLHPDSTVAADDRGGVSIDLGWFKFHGNRTEDFRNLITASQKAIAILEPAPAEVG